MLCAPCNLKLPKHNVVVDTCCVTKWKCSLGCNQTNGIASVFVILVCVTAYIEPSFLVIIPLIH